MASTSMRAARDTFLHYLADNLTTPVDGVNPVVHNLRVDKDDPKLNEIMLNAINISFHNSDISGPSMLSQLLVTVDVIYDYELIAQDFAEQIAKLLYLAAYAPLMDYSNPASPVQINNERMFWNLALPFKPVHSENFFHMSALLHLFIHVS